MADDSCLDGVSMLPHEQESLKPNAGNYSTSLRGCSYEQ